MARKKIPVDVTFEHYIALRSILQHVLEDLEETVGTGSKWVSCRLNQTGISKPKPYFLCWLENQRLRSSRMRLNKADPGLFRFMDDVDAPTYTNCLNKPMSVQKQDWNRQKRQRQIPQPTMEPARTPVLKPLYLYLKDGYFQLSTDNETYRVSVAIKVDEKYIGTLNTGLSTNPQNKLNKKMKDWGQSTASELVQYLKNEFDLGGPPVRRP